MIRTLRVLLAIGALAALAALAAPAPSRGDPATPIERAIFEIRVRGRVVGRENLKIEDQEDSLAVGSNTIQLLGARGTDSLIKNVAIKVDSYDLNLRDYYSAQRYRGHTLIRGLSLHDTVFTSYRELDQTGNGDTFVRPPGHLFVVDPGVFASFELICRMLRGRSFERRSVNLLVLGGETDTVVAAPLIDRGLDSLRHGNRRVPARRMTLGDEPGAYRIWMDRSGHLLRLEHVPSGLRVERLATPARHRPIHAS